MSKCECINKYLLKFYEKTSKQCDICSYKYPFCRCGYKEYNMTPIIQYYQNKSCYYCKQGNLIYNEMDIYMTYTDYKHKCDICNAEFVMNFRYPRIITQHQLVGKYDDLNYNNSMREWADRVEYDTYINIIGDKEHYYEYKNGKKIINMEKMEKDIFEYCKPAIEIFIGSLHKCNEHIDICNLKAEDIAYIAAVILRAEKIKPPINIANSGIYRITYDKDIVLLGGMWDDFMKTCSKNKILDNFPYKY